MDIDNPSSQSAASGTGPGQPLNAQGPPSLTAEDQLSKLDPQTALLIKGLFDAQLQQARESAAQEIKAAFNREWDAREQTYQARLQNAEREVAGLQHRIGAQTQPSVPPAASTPPPPNPLQIRLPETPQQGRGRTINRTPGSRRRQSRSLSPLQRRSLRLTGTARQSTLPSLNAAAGPSRIRDEDDPMDNATGRRSPGQNNSREELVVEEEEEEEDGEEERGGEDGLDDSSGNRQEFQLRRSDLPGDINGFKEALITHIRVLYRLLDTRSIPSNPSRETLDNFNERFTSVNELTHQSQHGGALLIDINRVRGASFLANSNHANSRIIRTVSRMEETIITLIDTSLARFGLTEWCPDFQQSPYSLYNAAHRIIAIDTFKHALISHSYASLRPKTSHIYNVGLVERLYNHVVHYFFRRRYIRNLTNPGSVEAEDDASPMYHNRVRLAKARRKWLKDNGFPQRYLDMVTTKSTSEDEKDPVLKIGNKPVYNIKTRVERAEKATRFFRILDAKREREARLDPSRRWKERIRRVPAQPIESTFSSIPVSMPIDYFDPAFYNSLPPNLRMKAATNEIALLPNIEDTFTLTEDECLTDAAFTNKFRDVRLAYETISEYSEADL